MMKINPPVKTEEEGEGSEGGKVAKAKDFKFPPNLRKAGYVTRDSREVERKKVGLQKLVRDHNTRNDNLETLI